ncbi:MAG TPA: cellulose binding domain-containing protein [Ruminiclostridium sp.]|nr:cellulose binding domain-containing protein [Ruminiclostridium sp.]
MKKQSRFISAALVFLLVLQLFAFVTNSNVYAAEGSLKVQMYMGNTSAASNTISPNFRICNEGLSPINMSDVKLRYYYTKDNSYTQTFVCDSCSYNNAQITGITGTFADMASPTPDSDNYVEISFPEGISLTPGTSIDLQTRIHNEFWINYNQSNDYSFNSAASGYVDCNKVTAYISGNLSWGVEPKVEIDNSPKKFLVISSSKIYGGCSDELNQYMADISNEGWVPTLIKVNNEQDPLYAGDESFHVCQNPQELKALIKQYYDAGYKGFVLIGSAPSIPNAYWESTPDSNDNIPSDLFYSDMDEWSDTDGDGEFEQPAVQSQKAPDMEYGRISAAGAILNTEMSETEKTQTEIAKTKGYLQKIHDFRLSGGKLNFDPKAFCFIDDDFVEHEPGRTSLLGELERDVHSVTNYMATNKNKFLQLLQGGYRIGYEIVHSRQENWGIIAHPNGTEDSVLSEVPGIEDINNITVKVNYIHLDSCLACDYTQKNIGAAFLFNNTDTYSTSKNSYVYNVTGASTICKVSPGYGNFLRALKSQNIGAAFKQFVSDCTTLEPGYPSYVLLGDPTLKYDFTKPANRCPHISNNLINVNAYPGKPFKLDLQTTDPENDPVFLDVDGLPEGAAYDSSTQTIDWVPQASQAGISYPVTLTAYNRNASGEPVNKYVEEFTIHVSRMGLLPQEIPNPGFESLKADGMPTDWTYLKQDGDGTLSLDSTVSHSGHYSAKITDGYRSYYELESNVQPNTRYLISGYIKTSNVTRTYPNGAGLVLKGNNSEKIIINTSLTGTHDWTPVYYYWNSEDNTSLKIQCQLGGSGTVWFDDIKLERDYNLGFESYQEYNSTPIYKWATLNLNADPNAIRPDSSVKRSGLYSASIAFDQNPNYGIINSELPVEPNTDYRVSAWVKTSSVTGGGLKLAVTCGSNTIKTEPVLGTDTEWKQIYVDLNSGDNTKIRVNFKLGELAQLATGTAWIDDLAIEKK